MSSADRYAALQKIMEHYAPWVRASARAILPIVQVASKSVVDFGCGRGDWLRVARELGASSVLGLDTHALDTGRPSDGGIPVARVDLTRAVELPQRFNLALCLEVGEHLPGDAAPELVASLVAAAPVVLFSAAAPHQGGVQHINEQPPSYWHALFQEHGYSCCDVRPLIWDEASIQPWYRMGLFVYCAPGRRPAHLDRFVVDRPLHLVHPDIFAAYGPRNGDVVLLHDEATGRWFHQSLA